MLHLRTLTDERCGVYGPRHLIELVDAVDRRDKKIAFRGMEEKGRK
jgi:hypothetical protein